MKKKAPKLCDDCEKFPAVTKLTVSGFVLTVNGKETKGGRSRAELCQFCTNNSMNDFARWLNAQRETA